MITKNVIFLNLDFSKKGNSEIFLEIILGEIKPQTEKSSGFIYVQEKIV